MSELSIMDVRAKKLHDAAPTVSEVIAALQVMPQDIRITIMDSDFGQVYLDIDGLEIAHDRYGFQVVSL